MTRLDPARSPVLDSLRAHQHAVSALETAERRPEPASALRWLRLAAIGVFSLAFVLLFHFPPWAVLVLPTAGLTTQALRRRRWLFRTACSAVLSAYAAQIVRLVDYPWLFRFAASFALFMAAAFCWGMRMDEFD